MVESEEEYKMNIVTIGESGVGKTSILVRYCNDKFNIDHLTTIGIDFRIKQIFLNQKQIKLKIWDTAGQERFQTLTKSYYKSANGIILVYDITDKKSFDRIEHWLNEIKIYTLTKVPIVLIGNKCDKTNRLVSYEQGLNLATNMNCKFFETSAYENKNINEAIECLVSSVLLSSQELKKPEEIKPIKKKKCC